MAFLFTDRCVQAKPTMASHNSTLSWGKVAIHQVIPLQHTLPSLGWPYNTVPGYIASLGERWRQHLREAEKLYEVASTATYSYFPLCPSDLLVSYSHPITFYSTVCLLYHCHCISLCLFLSDSLFSISFSHPSSFHSPLPALLCNSQRTSWPCPYQSVVFSRRVLWQEECIVYFGTPFVTLLIYFQPELLGEVGGAGAWGWLAGLRVGAVCAEFVAWQLH